MSVLLPYLTRLVLRAIAAILVYRGLLSPDDGVLVTSDPDLMMLVEAGIGLAVQGVAEAWFWLWPQIKARMGWAP